ncbi:MAG: serine/threonine protein kinase, partial [Glaciecola sp.]
MTESGLTSGRYTYLAELGRGGMATVHRARDEVLGREVAIKVLHSHLASDPAFRARFLREAQAAAALSHPNVVAIHDLDDHDGRAQLIMEVVDGPSLSEVLATRGRLAPGEVLALLGPAAAGLAAAHEAGLVHRDVKPGNILIALDGTVKVGDFGLARAAASSEHTFGSDTLVGSPHYFAPESVDGQPLGPTADVYALGVVAFEALTGRPPFAGDSAMATALQHTTRTVPPPSSIVAGLPASIDAVIQKATSRDPDARYPDAAAFGLALAAAT